MSIIMPCRAECKNGRKSPEGLQTPLSGSATGCLEAVSWLIPCYPLAVLLLPSAGGQQANSKETARNLQGIVVPAVNNALLF